MTDQAQLRTGWDDPRTVGALLTGGLSLRTRDA